ncbi:MAG: hypothetical protein P8102_11995, partial [Gammaproteobacteria bacterium]
TLVSSKQYHVGCDCGPIGLSLIGESRVRGFCHCEHCRDLLKIPYLAVTAWEKEQVTFDEGHDALTALQHPAEQMQS